MAAKPAAAAVVAEQLVEEAPAAGVAAPAAEDAPDAEEDTAPAPAGPELVQLADFTVGLPAPTDAYQAIGSSGGPTGAAYTTHPGGGATQLCTAGSTVTEGVLRALTAADAPSED